MKKFILCILAVLFLPCLSFALAPTKINVNLVHASIRPLSYEQQGNEITLGYFFLKQSDYSASYRKRTEIRIRAPRDLQKADEKALKNIVVALKEKYDRQADVFTVFFHFPPRSDGIADIAVHYALDGKGFGAQNWQWDIIHNTENLDAIDEALKKAQKKKQPLLRKEHKKTMLLI